LPIPTAGRKLCRKKLTVAKGFANKLALVNSDWNAVASSELENSSKSLIREEVLEKISFYFQLSGISVSETIRTGEIGKSLRLVEDELSLVSEFQRLMRVSLPEFRYTIKKGSQSFYNYSFPHSLETILRKSGSERERLRGTSNISFLKSGSGVVWIYQTFSTLVSDGSDVLVIGSPSTRIGTSDSRIFMSHILCQSYIEQLSLIRSKEAFTENERSKAIARTTQSLAHDVRKPFSMFKMIIDAVTNAKDHEEARELLKESLPEVQQAMASVNGMLSDVLEIGSESKPIAEPTNPETLIEATLNEIFRVYPDSKVDVRYALNHRHKATVDTLKVGRVFSNIVGNAVQAMNFRGDLWFGTEEFIVDGKSMMRFCLGNGGSFIPPESLPKLFDAFFTSGKKGGTGLGLAIAQKIVVAHGGKIWCESDKQRGVEFYFTLPSSLELCDKRTVPLPASSRDVVSAFQRFRKSSGGSDVSSVEFDPLESALESEIVRLISPLEKPFRLVIVDDEAIYRNSIAAILNRSESLKDIVSLGFAKNSDESRQALNGKPALMVLDVDLGLQETNGYELLREMRLNNFEGVVCIHSNRTSPEDFKIAVASGADAVLPKPMSRAHFLKLILQAAQREIDLKARVSQSVNLSRPSASNVPSTPAPSLPETDLDLPEIAYVDDSKIFLKSWQLKLSKDAIVHVFTSPADFRKHVDLDPSSLDRLVFVLTDFHFGKGVTENGHDFAEYLRTVFPRPIFLCSNGDFGTDQANAPWNAVLSKAPMSWPELEDQVRLSKGAGRPQV
jgi:DNA-binding NarL/FixJ family response regulator